VPLLPPREPAKLKPRGDFDAEGFRRLIFEKGAEATWEARAQCPCGVSLTDVATDMGYTPLPAYFSSRDSHVGCPVCKGDGYYLHSAQPIRLLVQDMRIYGRRFGPTGEYGNGSARLSMLPEHKPALGDRITLKRSVMLVREDRQRLTVQEDLRFPVAVQLQDLAQGRVAFRTLSVQKADGTGRTQLAYQLDEGVDFSVTPDGKIDWTLGDATGRSPAVNAYYTVSYYAHPRYVVIDLGYGVRDSFDGVHKQTPTHINLPIMAIARQEFLGTRGG